MNAKGLICFVILVLSASILYAQNEPVLEETRVDCADVLNQADVEFNAGHFYGRH